MPPKVAYGWIQVGSAVPGPHAGLFHVQGFQEKPPLPVAEYLFGSGSLWNTFVMVGHVDAFLETACVAVPGLLEMFRRELTRSQLNGETRIPDSLYDWISPTDFSRQILSPGARRLVTLRLENVQWNDLGDPNRVLSILLAWDTELPAWAKLWQVGRKAAGASAACRSSAAVA